MIAIQERYKKYYAEIKNEEQDDSEKLWIELGTATRFRIGLIYAPKGDKARKEEITTRYKNIEKEIVKGQDKEQEIIIIFS